MIRVKDLKPGQVWAIRAAQLYVLSVDRQPKRGWIQITLLNSKLKEPVLFRGYASIFLEFLSLAKAKLVKEKK